MKIENSKALKVYFKNQKLRCIIKKGGATMFENMLKDEDAKKIDQTVEDAEKEQEQEKNIAKTPLTLEEARQKLEFELLSNYLTSLNYDQAQKFLDTQVNLTSELKQKLQNSVKTSE
jgi:hypothetical protein